MRLLSGRAGSFEAVESQQAQHALALNSKHVCQRDACCPRLQQLQLPQHVAVQHSKPQRHPPACEELTWKGLRGAAAGAALLLPAASAAAALLGAAAEGAGSSPNAASSSSRFSSLRSRSTSRRTCAAPSLNGSARTGARRRGAAAAPRRGGSSGAAGRAAACVAAAGAAARMAHRWAAKADMGVVAAAWEEPGGWAGRAIDCGQCCTVLRNPRCGQCAWLGPILLWCA